MPKDVEVEIANLEADDWRHEIIEYLRNPSQLASRKLKYKALKYVLLDNYLYYRTIDVILLKCLNLEEAKVVMCEVHEGICATHQLAHEMRSLLKKAGSFWPNMLEDYIKYYKECQDC